MVLAWSKFLGIYNDFELNRSAWVPALFTDVSLNLDTNIFLGPNIPPMTILPFSVYLQRYHQRQC